jgi:phage baseplate assembly protein gpV
MSNLERDVNTSYLNKHFVGTVTAIAAPGTSMPNGVITNVTKLQVHIPPLHQGIQNDQLPYFGILRPIFRGAKSNTGIYETPLVGSKVVVLFDNNDEKSGLVIGELLDGSVTNSSFSNAYGWQDEFGNTYKVDLTSGSISLTGGQGSAPSNATMTLLNGATLLAQVGSTTITTTNDETQIVCNGTTVLINGSGVTITGNVTINGKLTVTDTIEATNEITGNSIDLSQHVHTYSPGSGSPTDTSTPTG